MSEKTAAILLAAGQGKRMNSSVAKQFLELQGKPILYYSLKAFQESSIDEVVLVTGEEQIDYCREQIINEYQFDKVSKIIKGGKERYDSVYHALANMKECSYVLIHDGARPFISAEQIEGIIAKVRNFHACVVGVPVKDTIKVINENCEIIATPNRNTLWSAQTPQSFIFTEIKKAYEMFMGEKDRSKLSVTDDAMVYETFLKKSVQMIPGDYNNIKITTPEDLIMADMILKSIREKQIQEKRF